MDITEPPGDDAARFVGAWSLVSWSQTGPDGRTEYPLGEDAVGRILYSADGQMAAHLMRRRRTPFRSEDPEASTLEERSAAYLEYFSYAGSYAIEPSAQKVTHTVAVCIEPHWVGRVLVRDYRFGADTLTLVSTWADGTVNTLEWQRL